MLLVEVIGDTWTEYVHWCFFYFVGITLDQLVHRMRALMEVCVNFCLKLKRKWYVCIRINSYASDEVDQLLQKSSKLIIIWVNYERNKKGARFFETQCIWF